MNSNKEGAIAMRKSSMTIITIICIFFIGLGSVEAALIWVRPGDSIQRAVNTAVNEDIIVILPGVYKEQVTISNKNLSLIGLMATISPSSLNINGTCGDGIGPVRAIISVEQGHVNIGGLRLDGAAADHQTGSGYTGIFYFNASGIVTSCSIINILDETRLGHHDAFGILAEKADLRVVANCIENSSNGMAFLEDCTVKIFNNRVRCRHEAFESYGDAALNGIELGSQSSGFLRGNVVSKILYLTKQEKTSLAATGIFARKTGRLNIYSNDLQECQVAIHCEKSSHMTISENRIYDGEWGIVTHDSADVLIQRNFIRGCRYGIWNGANAIATRANIVEDFEIGLTSIGNGSSLTGNHFVGGGTGISVYGDNNLIERNVFDVVEYPVLVAPRTLENSTADTRNQTHALSAFESNGALDHYLTDRLTDLFVQSFVSGGYPALGDPVTTWIDMEGVAGSGSNVEVTRSLDERPIDYTTTNVQEYGVDEPDLLKTNGHYIYYIQNSVLHIIDSWPAEEAHEIATVQLDGWGESIFLADDTVVAFTSIYEESNSYDDYGDYGYDDSAATDENSKPFSAVRMTVIDVTEPSSPSIVRTLDIEGDLVSSRLVDGLVYLVAFSSPSFIPAELIDSMNALDLPAPWDLTVEMRRSIAGRVRNLVRPIIADYVATKGRSSLIPDVRINGGDRSDLFTGSEILRPGYYTDFGMLTIIGLDPHGNGLPEGVGMIASGWHVYGSLSSLYIAQDSRWWWL